MRHVGVLPLFLYSFIPLFLYPCSNQWMVIDLNYRLEHNGNPNYVTEKKS